MVINAAEHLGLAGKVASRFAHEEGVNIEDSEAFGDALVGLMEAVSQFDASRGYTFSTFAVRVIYHRVLKGLKQRQRRAKVISFEEGEEWNIIDHRSGITQVQLRRVLKYVPQLTRTESAIVIGALSGASYKRIGSKIKIDRITVSSIWKRSVERIQKMMQESGDL